MTTAELNAMFLQLEEESKKRSVLLTEIQESFSNLKSQLAQANKALEFSEYMAKSGDLLLNALNDVEVANSSFDACSCDQTEFALDHATQARADAFSSLRADIYEFRKRVPQP